MYYNDSLHGYVKLGKLRYNELTFPHYYYNTAYGRVNAWAVMRDFHNGELKTEEQARKLQQDANFDWGFQKASSRTSEPTQREAALRDELNELLREAGMPVIDDVEEGQRVLDMANEADVRFGAKQKRALETATIAEQSTNNATVVSSADGAKVQKILETLADNYEKRPNKTKGFITDLSRSLGLVQHEASQYGTFETRNGKLVTIHVSNHNARVSFFDENGAVSIDGKLYPVKITLKEDVRNKRLPSNTHSYEATKIELLAGTLAKPEGDNPNTNNSISAVNLLENVGLSYNPSEKVLDASEKRTKSIREQRAYHGSGADFDKFDTMNHLSEGEGSQAFGAGTYVADQKNLGKKYASLLALRVPLNCPHCQRM